MTGNGVMVVLLWLPLAAAITAFALPRTGRWLGLIVPVILMAAGAAWALININSLPMVVDMTSAARLGTYTGMYYLFSTLAAITGPNVNGWIIQLTGNNYNNVMIVAPVFMAVALYLMLGVTRGEAVPSPQPAPAD